MRKWTNMQTPELQIQAMQEAGMCHRMTADQLTLLFVGQILNWLSQSSA